MGGGSLWERIKGIANKNQIGITYSSLECFCSMWHILIMWIFSPFRQSWTRVELRKREYQRTLCLIAESGGVGHVSQPYSEHC